MVFDNEIISPCYLFILHSQAIAITKRWKVQLILELVWRIIKVI